MYFVIIEIIIIKEFGYALFWFWKRYYKLFFDISPKFLILLIFAIRSSSSRDSRNSFLKGSAFLLFSSVLFQKSLSFFYCAIIFCSRFVFFSICFTLFCNISLTLFCISLVWERSVLCPFFTRILLMCINQFWNWFGFFVFL